MTFFIMLVSLIILSMMTLSTVTPRIATLSMMTFFKTLISLMTKSMMTLCTMTPSKRITSMKTLCIMSFFNVGLLSDTKLLTTRIMSPRTSIQYDNT
jgi:hypothetical protein